MIRFRIKTLLILTAILALGIFLWLRYITPNVAGLGVQGTILVVYLKPTSKLVQFHIDPNDPYAMPIPGPAPELAQGEHIFTHDAYVLIPLWIIAVALVILFGALAAGYLLVRGLASSPKRSKSSPPES